MSKVADYKLIIMDNSVTLQKSVIDAIEDGWQPLGSVIVNTTERGFQYTQTMIKTQIGIFAREVFEVVGEGQNAQP